MEKKLSPPLTPPPAPIPVGPSLTHMVQDKVGHTAKTISALAADNANCESLIMFLTSGGGISETQTSGNFVNFHYMNRQSKVLYLFHSFISEAMWHHDGFDDMTFFTFAPNSNISKQEELINLCSFWEMI